MASHCSSSDISEISWTQELEAALLGTPAEADVRGIARCRPLPDELRGPGWLCCLEVQHNADERLVTLAEIYDLPEQQLIREDIRDMVERLGNEEEDRVSIMSDVESVITHYCKSQRQEYCRSNGWVDILHPLVSLKLNKPQLYLSMSSILQRYVPRHVEGDGDAFHLLRLLLLYHDPDLCNFLDTRRVSPDTYCGSWLSSLFSAACALKVIQVLWDIYFQMDDPFMVFFFCLVMLINAKDQVMEMSSSPRDQIISNISNLPSFLQAEDLQDFCELACFYSNKTPKSFRRRLYPSLFGVCAPQLSSLLASTVPLAQSLCLPVYADELTDNVHGSNDSLHSLDKAADNVVGFFVVDCRPAEQYNAGHLSTAFHLDTSLMLSEPNSYNTAVSALMSVKQQSTTAQHLCFIGSGREAEDQFVHMVIASFLQKGTMFVSKLEGGYQALHDLLCENLSALTDHAPAQCVVCTGGGATAAARPDGSLLDRLGTRWRRRGQLVREKLVEIITNAPTDGLTDQQRPARHVSSRDRGKPYRNLAPIFSLDDENDADDIDEEIEIVDDSSLEVVEISSWIKRPDILHHFTCHQIKENQTGHPSVLLVSGTQLVVLRELAGRPGMAHVTARRSLSSVVQITSKKRRPELISFKYGINDGENISVTDLDRFYIPRAGDATKAVKLAILQLSETASPAAAHEFQQPAAVADS